MIELHVEGHDQFMTVTCSCGFTSRSRAEQWKHAADALRADVEWLHRLLNEQEQR